VSMAPLWVRQQLQDLQQHHTEAAAAGVPPELLQEMLDLADELGPEFEELGDMCMKAIVTEPQVGNITQEMAIFQAVLQGFTKGWLTKGLQQLGSKVWAAWPQKYACNDDRCTNRSGLTEQSCAKLRCSGCRVSVGCSLRASGCQSALLPLLGSRQPGCIHKAHRPRAGSHHSTAHHSTP
jgi:hypothetical protein